MSKMQLIIAGGREFKDYITLRSEFIKFVADHKRSDVTVISGMARGADTLGLHLAEEYSLPVITMPANWDLHGKPAGHIRNAEMAKIATHLLVAWDGKSPGTKGMITLAKKHNLVTKIINY